MAAGAAAATAAAEGWSGDSVCTKGEEEEESDVQRRDQGTVGDCACAALSMVRRAEKDFESTEKVKM